MIRTLLGTGPTPWDALADLAQRMRDERHSDQAVTRAQDDVDLRLMNVGMAARGQSGRWIVEATWVV